MFLFLWSARSLRGRQPPQTGARMRCLANFAPKKDEARKKTQFFLLTLVPHFGFRWNIAYYTPRIVPFPTIPISIPNTQRSRSLFTLKQTSNQTNPCFYKRYRYRCVRAAVLYKNIKLLHISACFIVKWQNCKMHIRTLSLWGKYTAVKIKCVTAILKVLRTTEMCLYSVFLLKCAAVTNTCNYIISINATVLRKNAE